MKIEIQNWGPVSYCKYDLQKSILITYGDNNIGKSYAMQTMYLLLKYLISYAEYIAYFRLPWGQRRIRRTAGGRNKAEDLVTQFAMGEASQKEITDDLIMLFQEDLEQQMLPELEKALKNTFGTYESILEESPQIMISWKSAQCQIQLKEKTIELKMQTKPIYLKLSKSNFHKSRETASRYDIYVWEEDRSRVSEAMALVLQRIEKIKRDFCRQIQFEVGNVYFLPASRSGIYAGMNSFGPILAQLSQSRAYIKDSFQIPSLSEPISDYYMALSTINGDGSSGFGQIASEIEKAILKGTVSFDKKRKSLMYQSELMEQALEMNDTSSMVSEISPITAYLKYIIRNDSEWWETDQKKMSSSPAEIIFIEEPEAHLHPANQVALMKIFAKLAKTNVKLVMASHSNYIFNELNNLILAGELDANSYSPILMKAENGKSRTYEMQMDELGVSDENFADIAEALYEERENLISALMDKWEREENKG